MSWHPLIVPRRVITIPVVPAAGRQPRNVSEMSLSRRSQSIGKPLIHMELAFAGPVHTHH
jgi:hypothetical protein